MRTPMPLVPSISLATVRPVAAFAPVGGGLARLLPALVGLLLWTGAASGGELLTEAPDCVRCKGDGHERCFACGGDGVSNRAILPCPDCNATGEVDCTNCNEEGIAKCRECSYRSVGGKRVRAIKNPDWIAWQKQFGPRAWKDDTQIPPPEPEKYAVCPDCKGTGKRECPLCKTTKKAECRRCEGTGKTTGRGPCPECYGYGKKPCMLCSRTQGMEDYASFQTVEELRKTGKVDMKGYYQHRRLVIARIEAAQYVFDTPYAEGLALLEGGATEPAAAAAPAGDQTPDGAAEAESDAQADAGAETPAAREEGEMPGADDPAFVDIQESPKPTPAERAPAAASKPATPAVVVDAPSLTEMTRKYGDQYGKELDRATAAAEKLDRSDGGVRDYRAKARGLGLPAEALRAVEVEAAKRNPAMAAYVQAKEAFRQGKISYQDYRESIGK